MRKEMGFSQSDVAKKSGLTQQMVSGLKRRKLSYSKKLYKVCRQFGFGNKLEKKNTDVEYSKM